MKNSDFHPLLFKKIINSLSNNYKNNKQSFTGEKLQEQFSLKRFFYNVYLNTRFIHVNKVKQAYSYMYSYGSQFEYVYNLLDDDASKKLLIDLVAFRMLGHEKVLLHTNTPEYWDYCEKILQYASENDTIENKKLGFTLNKTSLELFKIPISLYTFPTILVSYEFLHQYSFTNNSVAIQVEEGDAVLDCGGCYGENAILFGHKTGVKGKVYSFEFIPSNVEIFNKNIALNPHITNVEIVQHPLWNVSNKQLYYKDWASGSFVSDKPIPNYHGIAHTITLDDFMQNNSILKIDFIKMDIEGAELSVLEGAKELIKKYKPKLAISIYHSDDDFYTIPKFIHELGLDYSFHIGHYTIGKSETVLHAKIK